jgi:hypothetical protein
MMRSTILIFLWPGYRRQARCANYIYALGFTQRYKQAAPPGLNANIVNIICLFTGYDHRIAMNANRSLSFSDEVASIRFLILDRDALVRWPEGKAGVRKKVQWEAFFSR